MLLICLISFYFQKLRRLQFFRNNITFSIGFNTKFRSFMSTFDNDNGNEKYICFVSLAIAVIVEYITNFGI